MSTWTAALDRYEAALDHHRALLAGDEPAPGHVPWPPAELPGSPLPVEWRARAEQLLARTAELARDLEAARASLPPLPGHRAPRSATTGVATSSGRFDRSL